MEYQKLQPHENIIPYEMPHIPWEEVGANIFTIKIIHYWALQTTAENFLL